MLGHKTRLNEMESMAAELIDNKQILRDTTNFREIRSTTHFQWTNALKDINSQSSLKDEIENLTISKLVNEIELVI